MEGMDVAMDVAMDVSTGKDTFLFMKKGANPFNSAMPLVEYIQQVHAMIRMEPELPDFVPLIKPNLGTIQAKMKIGMKLDEDQEAIIDTIFQYVVAETLSEGETRIEAPLIALHAGPGTGKSTLAKELYTGLVSVWPRHRSVHGTFGCRGTKHTSGLHVPSWGWPDCVCGRRREGRACC